MKRILLSIFLFTGLSFAQNNQSIELPDFVITGSKNVSVQNVKKIVPDYNPEYSDFQFETSSANIDLPSPDLPNPELLKSENDSSSFIKNGNFSIGGGFYTQPAGKFFISSGFEHVRLNLNLMGLNNRDFVEYSRYNMSSIDGGLYFFISPRSMIFPGAKIFFKGNYSRESYRLFGSINPAQRRDNDISGSIISFSNFYSNYLNYSIDFQTNHLKMKSDNLQHIQMKVEPYVSLKFNSFRLFADASINTNKIYSSNSDYYSYQKYGGGIDLYLIRNLSVQIGLDYFNTPSSHYLKPYVESGFRFNKYFSIAGKFKPFMNYNSHADYLQINKYYVPNEVNNVLENHKLFSEISFLFELEKILKVQVKMQYDKIDSLLYFSEPNMDGKLTPHSLNNVNLLASQFNITLNAGVFGDWYFEANWENYFDKQKIYIPYYNDFSALLIYTKKLSEKFSAQTKFNYLSGSYYVLNSREKLPAIINLDLKFDYALYDNLQLYFDIENVLNKKNFYVRNYQSKPIDIIFGVRYKW